MDRLDAMLAFTRVVELRSFTQAATSLHLPKATLSAHIAHLEKHLGVKLLHRTTRLVTPTTDGAAYYDRVVQHLDDIQQTELAVKQANQQVQGRLRVDTSGTLARQIIIPALHDFISRYPNIELELGCTDRTVDLLQEGIDCAIRGGMPIDDTLVARKLIETSPITCASPTYLERFGTPKTLDDLAEHHVVNFLSPRTGKISGFQYLVDGEKHWIEGRRKLALNDIDACLSAALADIGVVQLPYFSVREHLCKGRLVRVLGEYPSEATAAYVVYLQNRHLSANVRVFVDWVVELFAQENTLYQAQWAACNG